MIDLLYLSHTVVPSHLAELEGLGVLETDELVLVALDGVLLDNNGRRISGPTLHDYCLLTTMRVLLWARNYGRHLFYAFPLSELCTVEGVGLDPLHAHLQLVFAVPGEEEQRFTFTLLPIADLPAAVSLLRLAADTAQSLAAQGVEPIDASAEVYSAVSEYIYGTSDGHSSERPYRRPGSESGYATANGSSFQQDSSGLPSGKLYSFSRVGRAAWDTFNRALREAEVPFNLSGFSGGDLGNVAETLRALNDLLTTVATNPGAREVAMAFLQRRGGTGGGGGIGDLLSSQPGQGNSAFSPTSPQPTTSRPMTNAEEVQKSEVAPSGAQQDADYHEIPLRRRGESSRPTRPTSPSSGSDTGEPFRTSKQQSPSNSNTPSQSSERGNTIPLRRRDDKRHSGS
jgi:hypothetical protein